MAPKRKAAPGGKRKAAEIKAASSSREVRQKIAAKKEEKLKAISHPSHGKITGEVYVFGDGDCGQLGLGEDITERLRPFPVNVDGKKILQVVCGGMHTVVLTEDRQVFSWGVNDEGALGRETTGELWEKSSLSTGSPGDAYTPGSPVDIPTTHGAIVQLSAGDSHTCALTELGAVWAWGTYRDGSGVMGFSAHTWIQLTPVCVYKPRTAAEQVVRIASGADHTAALTSAGVLLTWGSGQQGQLGRIGERLSERVKMDTLLSPHPVTIKQTRSMRSTRILDVNCGTYTTFVTVEGGHVLGWGLNNYGQLATPGLFPAYTPVLVKALEGKDVALVRSGQHHTVVLTGESKLLSFGRPTYGRLGQKDAEVSADNPAPAVAAVDGLEGIEVAGAAAGLAVSGCFDAEGRGWMWGFGSSNQLGKGDDDEDEITPHQLAETKKFSGQKIIQMEIGGQHVALLCIPKTGGSGESS